MEEVICHICGYEWTYKGSSEARYIQCPKCRSNIKNPNFKKPKGDE